MSITPPIDRPHGLSRRLFVRRLAWLAAAAPLGGLITACQMPKLSETEFRALAASAREAVKSVTMGQADEIRIGNKTYGPLIDQSGGPYRNRAVQRAVRAFARPLVEASSRTDLPWQITVLNDDTVNAWALPGGKLGINKGLLRYVADEHELAAILAHEIGHVECRHALTEMRTRRFTKSITGAGRTAADHYLSGRAQQLSDAAIDAMGPALIDLVTSGYSRRAEFEADAFILTTFAKLNFDPTRAHGFFTTLLQLIPESAQSTTSLFSSHPVTRERIAAIQRAATQMGSPRAAPKIPGFREIRATFPLRRYFRRSA